MVYKKQLRKAFSRGLRGKSNNVPGVFGRLFYTIGKDSARGVAPPFVKVEDVSTWSKLSLRLRLVWPYPHKFTVIHGSKVYTVDLSTYFYDFESIESLFK
jgi:hypothetical protein